MDRIAADRRGLQAHGLQPLPQQGRAVRRDPAAAVAEERRAGRRWPTAPTARCASSCWSCCGRRCACSTTAISSTWRAWPSPRPSTRPSARSDMVARLGDKEEGVTALDPRGAGRRAPEAARPRVRRPPAARHGQGFRLLAAGDHGRAAPWTPDSRNRCGVGGGHVPGLLRALARLRQTPVCDASTQRFVNLTRNITAAMVASRFT